MTEDMHEGEFIRQVDVSDIEPGQRELMKFLASAEECAAIAARLKLVALSEFVAEIYVFRELSGDVSIFGDLSADVTQACVVTLDPVHDSLGASVMQRYTDREDDEEAEDEDPVEPITEDKIEVGEVLVQNLSLALNPYPRAPGVTFEPVDESDGEPSGPFAALAQLRHKGENPEK
jgi:uncharacterized metal-binding protein YceD (DUF177 family)